MYAAIVRELKKHPSRALREAEHAPVLILKENEPHAVLLHLERALAKLRCGPRSRQPSIATQFSPSARPPI